MTEAQLSLFDSGCVAQYSDVARTAGELRPKPCVCEHPLLFAAEMGEGRCGLCGREPRKDNRPTNGHNGKRTP